MKNLFNKITKKVILPLVIAGAFSFNSYSQISELEKYNLENKQLHEDFINFCKENPNKRSLGKSRDNIEHYHIEFPNKKYSIDFNEKRWLHLDVEDTSFYDDKGDGLNNNSLDEYLFIDKKTNRLESELLEDLPPEKQLFVAKQYTNLKKQILHDEKDMGY
ncbi:hypothetical protein HYS72_03570 [Candidatus Pacearchaeota archaeon]|nr:hypothetical protein [Candidatus Pacearchaeota archaeon]MBI2056977.1 hypothetical protein [Candidatus Pacearchaeota archaeon]